MTITPVKVTQTGSTYAGHDVSASEFLQQAAEPSRITRSQIYYWSQRWQDDETDSIRELESGQGLVFESGEDLVSWLLADEPSSPHDED